jgi:hypothetical protein
VTTLSGQGRVGRHSMMSRLQPSSLARPMTTAHPPAASTSSTSPRSPCPIPSQGFTWLGHPASWPRLCRAYGSAVGLTRIEAGHRSRAAKPVSVGCSGWVVHGKGGPGSLSSSSPPSLHKSSTWGFHSSLPLYRPTAPPLPSSRPRALPQRTRPPPSTRRMRLLSGRTMFGLSGTLSTSQ